MNLLFYKHLHLESHLSTLNNEFAKLPKVLKCFPNPSNSWQHLGRGRLIQLLIIQANGGLQCVKCDEAYRPSSIASGWVSSARCCDWEHPWDKDRNWGFIDHHKWTNFLFPRQTLIVALLVKKNDLWTKSLWSILSLFLKKLQLSYDPFVIDFVYRETSKYLRTEIDKEVWLDDLWTIKG